MRAVVYQRPFEVAVDEVPTPRIEQPNDVVPPGETVAVHGPGRSG